MPTPAKLRFGIMCKGTEFPQWEADLLRRLVETPGVEPALLIIDNRPAPPRRPWWKRFITLLRGKGVLYSLYMRYCVEPYCSANFPQDLSGLLGHVDRLGCTVRTKGKFSEYFSEEDIARIRAYDLDFILRFEFNIIRGEILEIPRYGVWSFHHDDIDKYRGGPPCFWEIFFGDPETEVTLQKLTDRLDGGIVLERGWVATVLDSYARNLNNGLRLGIPWPARLCAEILEGRTEKFFRPPSPTHAKIYYRPTNRETIVYLARWLRRKLIPRR